MVVEMSDKDLAEIICRALLAIVAALRKKYDLPNRNGIILEIREGDTVTGVTGYNIEK